MAWDDLDDSGLEVADEDLVRNEYTNPYHEVDIDAETRDG